MDTTPSIPIDQAQANLAELIRGLSPGEAVVLTKDDEPVAQLVATAASKTPRKLGSLAGTVEHMADDFDAPLDDFREYSE